MEEEILHLTEQSGFASFIWVKCKIYLRFTLPLPQTAVAKFAVMERKIMIFISNFRSKTAFPCSICVNDR